MILLEDRSLLSLTGDDVTHFLQGLVTCDVTLLNESSTKSLYGALLSPQGKIRFDFFLYPHPQGGVLMDVAHWQCEDVKKILRLYILRSDVTLAEAPEWAVIASLTAADTSLPPDPRLAAMGNRGVMLRDTLLDTPLLPLLSYHAHRIAQGIPDSSDFIADRAFAAEYGLEYLNAVSYTKGCYVGQEVVARTKHRGTVHKKLHHVVLEDGHNFPPKDTAIMVNEKEIGQLRTHIANKGLAIIRSDKLNATNASPTAEGKKIIFAQLPEWFETA